MGKKKGKKQESLPLSGDSLRLGSAIERHHQKLGERVEELKHTLAWRKDRELFPYSVRVSWPETHAQEYLVVLKVVLDGEPQIAFHSGMGFVGSVLSMSDRYRAGKLKFTADRFPPENFDKVREHVEERVAFLNSLRDAPPQGSKAK